MAGKQTQLCKIGDIVAQRMGEGFDERTAAGGAGFVKHDGIHYSVFQLKAFHILSADVHDEVHIGTPMFGGIEMSDCFYNTIVDMKCIFDEFFSVACNGRGPDSDSVTAKG